eukprot:TRINITY_DN6896_c0_g3_i1.p2 TRINITY_DN6896_c0_g3~~TRINITY_DN6896_c0_g3_i1.p2  ORF type:complete len:120 (-),score=1.46 TRINITY_DN6896_c0_g3_i1:482-817(-)
MALRASVSASNILSCMCATFSRLWFETILTTLGVQECAQSFVPPTAYIASLERHVLVRACLALVLVRCFRHARLCFGCCFELASAHDICGIQPMAVIASPQRRNTIVWFVL